MKEVQLKKSDLSRLPKPLQDAALHPPRHLAHLAVPTHHGGDPDRWLGLFAGKLGDHVERETFPEGEKKYDADGTLSEDDHLLLDLWGGDD